MEGFYRHLNGVFAAFMILISLRTLTSLIFFLGGGGDSAIGKRPQERPHLLLLETLARKLASFQSQEDLALESALSTMRRDPKLYSQEKFKSILNHIQEDLTAKEFQSFSNLVLLTRLEMEYSHSLFDEIVYHLVTNLEGTEEAEQAPNHWKVIDFLEKRISQGSLIKLADGKGE